MPDRPQTIELVRRTPLFAAAGEAAMTRLLRPSFTQILPRGAVMFEQHQQADFLHLLLEGSVGLMARDETGAEFPWYELSIVPVMTAFLRYALMLDQGHGAAPEEVFGGDRVLQLLGVVWVAIFAAAVYT